MKTIWNFLIGIAESVHLARQATRLTRAGRYSEAQKLFSK